MGVANKNLNYQVLIIGAGIAGLTLARLLQAAGISVAVVEAAPVPKPWSAEQKDVRVSAITPASEKIFEHLGVWNEMKAMRISPFREIKVWDATGQGKVHFDSAEVGAAHLGHIIENGVMQSVLSAEINDMIAPVSIKTVDINPEFACLTLEDGRQLRSELLVGADGSQSWLRNALGMTQFGRSYDQTAMVATVQTEQPHQKIAYQRFDTTGPLAFLPLSDPHLSSIVWSVNVAEAERLLSLKPESFLCALEQAFDFRLGKIVAMQQPRPLNFPLQMQHTKHYVQARAALIGDAAHTLHPLAGQGLNLGLLDAACLAEVLIDAYGKHQDLGDCLGVLRRYERWRKGHTWAMIGVMEGFKRLFASELYPLKWLRNTGFNLVDQCNPVKSLIMRHMMGQLGDLPRFAR